MIALRNVSKRYKGIAPNKDTGIYLWAKNAVALTGNRAPSVLALSGVSFSVERGEVFGIYGANGAGKTTLIKLLSGLLAPSEGTVEVGGSRSPRRIKNIVSCISTNGWMGLEWQLSARENLTLYGNIFGLSGKELDARSDAALEAVGMRGEKDKYISELSAGMRQKITIARGLILGRPVIFFDEPSVSLDVQSSKGLRELIAHDAASNGRTAIVASHNAEDLAICGRIMLLWRGKIIALGTLQELKRPLSGLKMFEIRCLNQGKELQLESVAGVCGVTCESLEGKRDMLSIKLSARGAEFSFDRLIDYLIERGVAAHSINPIEISLQEVYEYYLSQNMEKT